MRNSEPYFHSQHERPPTIVGRDANVEAILHSIRFNSLVGRRNRWTAAVRRT
jgi:hypothetical protein